MDKKITLQQLKKLPNDQIEQFIYEVLKFDKSVYYSLKHNDDEKGTEHYRFDMTGFDDANEHNNELLRKFSFLGLSEKFDMLIIRFYKGSGEVRYVKYGDTEVNVFDVSGMGTRDIIFKILIEI